MDPQSMREHWEQSPKCEKDTPSEQAYTIKCFSSKGSVYDPKWMQLIEDWEPSRPLPLEADQPFSLPNTPYVPPDWAMILLLVGYLQDLQSPCVHLAATACIAIPVSGKGIPSRW